VIASQTDELVPADGLIYALRDATATVPSIPLIASSVMAKKLAIEADLILLDAKAGPGAFMADVSRARALADACLAIAEAAGRRAIAAITDMSQPLGVTIGNALEVAEAGACLPARREGGCAMPPWRSRLHPSPRSPGTRCWSPRSGPSGLEDGSALAGFSRFVHAQGGDERVAEDPAAVLPLAPVRLPIDAPGSGWVGEVNAAVVGEAASALGAGRHRKDAPIDPAVGIVLTAKVGDRVEGGEMIGEVHARTDDVAESGRAAVLASLRIQGTPIEGPTLIHSWVGECA
jgi:thymidine phosphorylase